jgi:nucleoside-diphosphate kinase
MERTLMLIKPDALKKRAFGQIILALENEGFYIIGAKMVRLVPADAEAFYGEHKARSFFASLVQFMTSGRIVALALEREDAVQELRKLIGATDSRLAAPNTLRARFGTDNQQNAVHGSDSAVSAARETAFFFKPHEILAE